MRCGLSDWLRSRRCGHKPDTNRRRGGARPQQPRRGTVARFSEVPPAGWVLARAAETMRVEDCRSGNRGASDDPAIEGSQPRTSSGKGCGRLTLGMVSVSAPSRDALFTITPQNGGRDDRLVDRERDPVHGHCPRHCWHARIGHRGRSPCPRRIEVAGRKDGPGNRSCRITLSRLGRVSGLPALPPPRPRLDGSVLRRRSPPK